MVLSVVFMLSLIMAMSLATPPTTAPTTTSPPSTTTPPWPCVCEDGHVLEEGGSHSVDDCTVCTCNNYQLETLRAHYYHVNCVDSINIEGDGHCQPFCPNGPNCQVEFNSPHGQQYSEIIPANGQYIDFEYATCICDESNYNANPQGHCFPILPPTTTPAWPCVCDDGYVLQNGETHSLDDCSFCECSNYEVTNYYGDCWYGECADGVNVEGDGHCCPLCANGPNCQATYPGDDGIMVTKIIPADGQYVDLGSAVCICGQPNYYEIPTAQCTPKTTTEPSPTTTGSS